MASSFALSGSFESHPTVGDPSGVPSLVAPLDERLQLQNQSVQFFDLTADSAVAVLFPAGFGCNVLVVKANGGKVKVRVTSSDGATQAIPVDGFLALITQSVPITAIDLTRDLGVEVQVQVFMGMAA